MDQVQFLHAREEFFGVKDTFGGMTFAYKLDSVSRSIKVAISECSLKDVFCKKTGRDIATSRLESNQFVEISELQIQNYIDSLIVPHIIIDKSIVASFTLEKLSRKFTHHFLAKFGDELVGALQERQYGPLQLDF